MSRPLVVILAAGEGTRMRSGRPKVLHAVAGRPMLWHVAEAARAVPGARLAVVAGPGMEAVGECARAVDPEAELFVQNERLGTAHALLAAREALAAAEGPVLVVFGDTPLIRAGTLAGLAATLDSGGADVAVLGFRARDPAGYGRLLVEDGALLAIREDKDASPRERAIDFCNAGVMGLSGRLLPELVEAIGNANSKGEYYLTDAVETARERGLKVVALEGEEEEFAGVNTRAHLAEAEAAMQVRLRAAAMEAGARLVAPETVFLAADTRLGRDVVVEPNVVFGAGVDVGEGAVIHAFSHLEGASVGPGAQIGPFARLRPGTRMGAGAKAGNFVEIKASAIAEGAKVNHLTYIGDAEVGEGANIGAGTITCNYDGFRKHRTTIGAGAFVGSNSALVAPVRIGQGAYIGSGSVVTDDVPDDALALARGRQTVKAGWAERFRNTMARLKSAGKG